MKIGLMLGANSVPVSAPAVGTVFASNTFTAAENTTLQTIGFTHHTSYSGVGNMTVLSNRAANGGGANTNVYYDPASPTNADYDVEANLHFFTDISVQFGVAGRVQTGANTMYLFIGVAGATDEWRLRKIVAGGALTTIDSEPVTWVAGTDYAIKLEMRGTAIKGYVNGVEVCSATDSDITLAGKAGLFAFGTSLASAGMHIDDFVGRNAA